VWSFEPRYGGYRGLLYVTRQGCHCAAYDALWVNRKDLRGLPFTRRKRALTGLVPATTTVVSQVFSVEGRGRVLFDAAERLDLEGIVAKRKAAPYRPGTVWYKIQSRTYTQGEGAGSCSRKSDSDLRP
jgi:ATP-dependent DNA ligase